MTTKVMVFTALFAIATAGALRAQQPADAASLYARSCASCHGAKGTASPAMARAMPGLPDFAAASMASVPDSALRNVIENGKGRIMRSYKTQFTAEQIAALVTYIKTFSRH
jgi:mono/diheme cytochrome c family protein